MFELGEIYFTKGVLENIDYDEIINALNRHQNGDFGCCYEEDKMYNLEAIANGYRVFSVYYSLNNIKFWIITEADRTSTTVLLPEEY